MGDHELYSLSHPHTFEEISAHAWTLPMINIRLAFAKKLDWAERVAFICQSVVKNTAKWEDILFPGSLATVVHLWSHVAKGSNDTVANLSSRGLVGARLSCRVEICQNESWGHGVEHQDVLWLDVSVTNFPFMQVLHCFGDILETFNPVDTTFSSNKIIVFNASIESFPSKIQCQIDKIFFHLNCKTLNYVWVF